MATIINFDVFWATPYWSKSVAKRIVVDADFDHEGSFYFSTWEKEKLRNELTSLVREETKKRWIKYHTVYPVTSIYRVTEKNKNIGDIL